MKKKWWVIISKSLVGGWLCCVHIIRVEDDEKVENTVLVIIPSLVR
jgi:hypothetical protein